MAARKPVNSGDSPTPTASKGRTVAVFTFGRSVHTAKRGPVKAGDSFKLADSTLTADAERYVRAGWGTISNG